MVCVLILSQIQSSDLWIFVCGCSMHAYATERSQLTCKIYTQDCGCICMACYGIGLGPGCCMFMYSEKLLTIVANIAACTYPLPILGKVGVGLQSACVLCIRATLTECNCFVTREAAKHWCAMGFCVCAKCGRNWIVVTDGLQQRCCVD